MPEKLIPSKDHWRYPAVPEARIDEDCINAVSKELQISLKWVQRIHDFQWKYGFDNLEQGNTVYFPKFFRVMMKAKTLNYDIAKLQKRQKAITITLDKFLADKERHNLLPDNYKKKKLLLIDQAKIDKRKEVLKDIQKQIQETEQLMEDKIFSKQKTRKDEL